MTRTATVLDYQVDLQQELGKGGMGVVYRGIQISLGRPVAVKVIRSDLTSNTTFVERFRKEAELLAQVIDGNVVQVFGAGEMKGRFFYAMELVEGEDLARRIRGGTRFTPDEILNIAEGVGKALRAAWRFLIVHRDIKPSNILIAPDGGVKVADFGLAKSLAGEESQTMFLAGTTKYISPEQGLGQPIDTRSDLYSLGIVLYEMATARLPFAGDEPTSLIYQHVHAAPKPPRALAPDLPEVIEKLILRCLAKEPAERFATPDEFLLAVQDARDQIRGVSTSTIPLLSPAAAPAPAGAFRSRPRPARLAALLGVGTAFVAAAGFYAWSSGSLGVDELERRRDAIDLALGLGNTPEAMTLAERYFGKDSPEFRHAETRHREAKLREWEGKAAEAVRRKEWEEAAKAYEVMMEFADATRKEELTAGLAFCRDLAAARKEEAAGAWERALDIYRRRITAPGEHRAYLDQSIKRASAGLEWTRSRAR